jgi:DNA-cytosine methyltransferase
MNMNILSLFDGMSCGRIAADRVGIEVGTYYASELDKYAITVTQANWPDTVQLGDVTKWREWDIEWASIDLLIGGSPCQGFSLAGKQLAFDDPRSKLFFAYVDILNYIRLFNPKVKFMLENVKMKKEYLDAISKILEVEPILINSNLVSAQNRQRYYWSNFSFSDPVQKDVLINDILQNEVEEKFYVSDKQLLRLNISELKNGGCRVCFQSIGQNINKSECLQARDYKGISGRQYFTTAMTNGRLRKLTPIEYERLQTVPDNYTNHVSNTQRYKMLGNGWTVDVIAHIFKQL